MRNRQKNKRRCLYVVTFLATVLLTGIVSPTAEAAKKEKAVSFAGEEWYDQIETVEVNREPAHADFIPYESAEVALANEKSALDEKGAEDSKYYQTLNGTWKFYFSENPASRLKQSFGSAAAGYAENWNTSGWDTIEVPSNTQMQKNADGSYKYDKPIYTNQTYPWANYENVNYNNGQPKAPTVVNGVGHYKRTFTIPESWNGRQVFVSFQGVESAFYLYVNGQRVGYAEDSYTPDDFNITSYLKTGENTIAVEVYRWSTGSYLENQDFIRLSGIFRDVYLYSKANVEIRDIFAVTDLSSDGTQATVNFSADVKNLAASAGNYTVEAQLYDADNRAVWDQPISVRKSVSAAKSSVEAKADDTGVTFRASKTVSKPNLWYAESPYLYRLHVQLKDSRGNVLENACIRLGMREIGTVSVNSDGQQQIQINGKKIMLRGVNRHETDPENGRALTKETILKDVQMMKSFNINAVRTAHYPNNGYLYDLADELGLYVCDEANVESHLGAIYSTIPSASPVWNASVMDRTKNMVERDKNHPSVVIWSLGNEATYDTYTMDDNYCFYNSTRWILERDPSRIRKYERDNRYTAGNRAASMVDVYSSQYWSVDYCLAHLKNTGNKLPYIQSEYAHAMGNGLGNLAEYWQLFRNYDNANGGFIWDWVDQALYNKTSDGTTYFAYGGDWGEKVTDRDFCANGILNADRTPSPEVYEVKKVLQEISFYDEDIENGKVRIVNEFLNTNLNQYRVLWNYVKDNKMIANGELTGSDINIAPGASKVVQIALPQVEVTEGSDYVLTFSVERKEDTAWANAYGGKAGDEIAFEQFEFELNATEAQPAMNGSEMGEMAVEETDSQIAFGGTTENGETFHIVISKKTGYMTQYQVAGKDLLTEGPVPNYWRAATSNDKSAGVAGASSNLKDAASNFKVNQNRIKVERNEKVVTVTVPGTISNVNSENILQYTVYANGVVKVTNSFTPSALCGKLARVGMKMTVASGLEQVTYYGKGEQENYPDRNTGAKLGIYQTTVTDLFESKYVNPQENGNRTGTRWVSLMDDASQIGILVSAEDTMEFSALHYTAEELAAKAHPHELKKLGETILTIDKVQRGLGNASCGPDALSIYQLPTGTTYTHTYSIRPISGTRSSAADFADLCMEKSNQNMNSFMPISGITVDGVLLEDFAADKTEYRYERLYSKGMGAPVVDVVKTSADVEVTVEQIQEQNGMVVITAISPYGVKAVYYVTISTVQREYLSDMTWTSSTNGYFANTRDMCGTNPIQLAVDEGVKTYRKGVGMHATASVTVNISGKGYTRFSAVAGINYNQVESNNGNSNVNLVVTVDGREKLRINNVGYNSTGNVFSVPIDVDVTNARTVTVTAEKGINDYSDHVSWADAKFTAVVGETDDSFVDGVIAARNIAAVTSVNKVPALPDKVSGLYADGTLRGEFPVVWETMRASQFSTANAIVSAKGTVSLGNGKTLPVTASIRVAEETANEPSNQALEAALTQNIAAANQSDNLASVINGTTKPGNNSSERWTNYNNRKNSATAALTFTWGEKRFISSTDLYYYIDDYSAMKPSAVKFEYSVDGKNYTSLTAGEKLVESYDLGARYTYSFSKPVEALALRITFTQQGGTAGEKCVGLTEAEITGYKTFLEAGAEASLSAIFADDELIDGFEPNTMKYEVVGTEDTSVTADAEQNMGITILPMLDKKVRILTLSEDGSNDRLYTVTITEEVICRHENTEIRDAADANCTMEGYTGDSYCADCGELLGKGTVIQAKGHVWDEGVVTKEATATEDGMMLYTCTVCQWYREEVIPATGEPEEPERPEELKAPTAGLTVSKGSDGKLTLTGKFEDYENVSHYYDVTAHGLVYYTTAKLGRKQLTVNTSGRTRVNFSKYKEDGTFTYDMTPANGNTKYTIRTFLAYRDKNGKEIYVYSDPVVAYYNGL